MESGPIDKCRSSALDYGWVPLKERDFVGSALVTVDCGLALPKPIDNLILRFSCPSSKLMLDGLQTFLCLEFSIVDDKEEKLPARAVKVAPECGPAGAIVERLELWNQVELFYRKNGIKIFFNLGETGKNLE
jgi:hypothetical protein